MYLLFDCIMKLNQFTKVFFLVTIIIGVSQFPNGVFEDLMEGPMEKTNRHEKEQKRTID